MPCILKKRHDLCEKGDNFITKYQESILLSCVGIEIIQSDLRSLNCEVKHVWFIQVLVVLWWYRPNGMDSSLVKSSVWMDWKKTVFGGSAWITYVSSQRMFCYFIRFLIDKGLRFSCMFTLANRMLTKGSMPQKLLCCRGVLGGEGSTIVGLFDVLTVILIQLFSWANLELLALVLKHLQ